MKVQNAPESDKQMEGGDVINYARKEPQAIEFAVLDKEEQHNMKKDKVGKMEQVLSMDEYEAQLSFFERFFRGPWNSFIMIGRWPIVILTLLWF